MAISHDLHFSFPFTNEHPEPTIRYYCKYKSYPLQQLIIGSTFLSILLQYPWKQYQELCTQHLGLKTYSHHGHKYLSSYAAYLLSCYAGWIWGCKNTMFASWVQYHCWQCWHYRHTNKTVPPQTNVDMFCIIRDSNQPGGFSNRKITSPAKSDRSWVARIHFHTLTYTLTHTHTLVHTHSPTHTLTNHSSTKSLYSGCFDTKCWRYVHVSLTFNLFSLAYSRAAWEIR